MVDGLRAAVITVNTALRELNDAVDGTNLMCGLEDVLDRWDDFTDQFNLTEDEING